MTLTTAQLSEAFVCAAEVLEDASLHKTAEDLRTASMTLREGGLLGGLPVEWRPWEGPLKDWEGYVNGIKVAEISGFHWVVFQPAGALGACGTSTLAVIRCVAEAAIREVYK